MTYRAHDLPPELRRMYEAYLKIDRQLDERLISGDEALRRTNELQVTDAYDGVWTIVPETGRFNMQAAQSSVRRPAEPRNFRSTASYEDLSDLEGSGEDTRFAPPRRDAEDSDESVGGSDGRSWGERFKDKPTKEKAKFFAWCGVGLLAVLLLAAALLGGGEAEEGEHQSGSAVAPGVDDAERPLSTLMEGTQASVEEIIPSVSGNGLKWMIAQLEGMESQGYTLAGGADGEINVVDAQGDPVASAMGSWKRDGGKWTLDSAPDFSAVPGGEVTAPAEEG